ncbi:cobyrinic acid A,C-diamide synthase [Methanobrevibacter cuticularis]|uniref:Cobyrinic acid A,C-diamide synthase n=1 Tax=Methanobrevibacter cuticularis TaxID=47311 RepID=A0A166EC79_9EURY|nr:AAA family ATPase [Methanobrevibacter cuticularis]KZX16498.1 cobyrinic acid A,C-diamide synthase [Methanobrevibacter cuticularis]
MMNIGLAYIKGSLPGFEDFGNLPTNIVKSNGLVNGIKAHKVLDGIIIPGGSIIEANSLGSDLEKELKKIASEGKFIIGICSGFQSLANQTDVGRKSPCPIIKKGIGLLDVDFSPLINNDRVEAYTKNDSFLTHKIKDNIRGFHSHTYGNIENNEIPIIYSKLRRANYSDVDSSVLSGVRNDDGNVIGTMIHGILDNNPLIVENVFNFLDATGETKKQIFEDNKKVKKVIKTELAINSGIAINYPVVINKGIVSTKKIANNDFSKSIHNSHNTCENNIPPTLMIGSTGSDSGKTFITTGIAGALTKKGFKVAILKVGPDVRDTIPALYLTKGKMEDFASIKIGHLGWMDIEETLKRVKKLDYDFVVIEGVMSVFTGLLNEKIPYSGVEIAISSNIPLLLVSGVNKGGIESAAIDLIAHSKILKEMGVNINGIILNKVYDMKIFNEIATFIENQTGVEEILAIPKIKLDERKTTPEVEINYDDFSLAALDTIEKYLDLETIIQMMPIPKFQGYLSFDEIKKYF